MDIEKCIVSQFWSTFHSCTIFFFAVAVALLFVVAYIRYVNKQGMRWVVISMFVLATALSTSAAFRAASGMYLTNACGGAIQ